VDGNQIRLTTPGGSADPFVITPGDVGPGEPPDKVAAALARFRCEDAVTLDAFDRGYELLHAQFGPLNEFERREVLEAWFVQRSRSPPEAPIRAFYHLLTLLDSDGRVAAVRDGFSAVDVRARRVVELMSHGLVLPEWRRSGVAALLRAAPVVYARRHGPPGAELSVVAEMEPVTRTKPDTLVRLVAYGRGGFRVIPPPLLPYAQPDFRDVDALGIEAKPIPFMLVVRQVGEEDRDTISVRRAMAIVDHIAAIHRPSVSPAQLDRTRALATRGLDPGGPDLPLWRLPTSMTDTERITPLLDDNVLPLFPAEWQP
jgi:hypothetical protein